MMHTPDREDSGWDQDASYLAGSGLKSNKARLPTVTRVPLSDRPVRSHPRARRVVLPTPRVALLPTDCFRMASVRDFSKAGGEVDGRPGPCRTPQSQTHGVFGTRRGEIVEQGGPDSAAANPRSDGDV